MIDEQKRKDDVRDQQSAASIRIDDETAQRIFEVQRQYRRRIRIAKFLTKNPVAWFFEEFPPLEMYMYLPDPHVRRTTQQEANYHWFRQRSGWTFLSQLGTSAGVRFAAISGLVSAVFQAAPVLNPQGSTAIAFRWLLISGAMYLCAAVWFELFCPLLLKQTLKPRDRPLGMHGRRWLRALVEDELRRWWNNRPWLPHPAMLDLTRMEDETALIIMERYGTPAFTGFDSKACAHIDLALKEFSQSQNIKFWVPSDEDGIHWRRHEVVYSFGGGDQPFMQRLRIYRPSKYELEDQSEVTERDLVVEWDRSGIEISHRAPNRRDLHVAGEAEGLTHLFENDADARTFATIVAGWQDTIHPFRRLVLFGLYFLSLVAFLCFIASEIHTVAHGLFPLTRI